MHPHPVMKKCLILFFWIWFQTGLLFMTAEAQEHSVSLHWLGGRSPAIPAGVSWGVPWPRGTVEKGQSFILKSSAGDILPLQHWTLAYWPDGSIKWTGFATVVPSYVSGPFTLIPAEERHVNGQPTVKVTENKDDIEINTGKLQCRIPRNGPFLIDSLSVKNRIVARKGRLICILQHGPGGDILNPPSREKFISQVRKVTVEQRGPVRAVIRVEGVHRAIRGDRRWLPFIVRFYFYAGLKTVRMVHTMIFDGDQNRDFIHGLGLFFSVPMREEVQNRHICFAGQDSGLWAEPVQPLTGHQPLIYNGQNVYPDQVKGKKVPDYDQYDKTGQHLLDEWVVWNDYRLTQNTANGFTIRKRTNPQSAWIKAAGGRRASGLVFAGDVSGGLSVGIQDFWQSCPSMLEIRNAAGAQVGLRIWLWSPDAPSMDMRHYDTRGHGLKASYEDYQPGFSTAYGVAKTSELTLFPSSGIPSSQVLECETQLSKKPPLLVCTPDYYHSVQMFGYWSLPDRSTPVKRHLENQLDLMFRFYHRQVDERNWYGFWDYGDIMHTYDPVRHSWMYDVGGYAWMNTEEMPNLWLWYSFLRTGRADIFRMAEAMTRQTEEVDVYHTGRFTGLGSRHNVRHWGDGAKELRISQSLLKRFYYYLTTDERTGKLMRDEDDADYALLKVDPLREILPKSRYPTHIRSGPDWLAAAGNWMTEWERTGNTKYRDKIVTGMKALASMPKGLMTALSFGYDPKTGMLYNVPEKIPVGQFVMIMGGAETAFELNALLNVPEWSKAWLDLCEYWARTGGGDMAAPRAIAYAAYIKDDSTLGRLAWKRMFEEGDGTGYTRFPEHFTKVKPSDAPVQVEEVPKAMASGHLSQWALNIIETLQLAGKWLPESR